ncbi:uncharacterized protein LOC119069155 [Bradysia coprophila]|uniref:uncharacterized protein LOC119069155 n=1 Tax=Bradysia coprophila TaxID=38358 RepID=UPI00187D6F6C|nr:uncharacterized protein LOC119069155 [Bradysia coprophila]
MDTAEMPAKMPKLGIPSGTLLSLDDMVLLEILNHLIVIDLVNLGKTCRRLAYLTQRQFEKHYSIVTWKKNFKSIKLGESSTILRNIGKHIRKIRLAVWSDLELHKILVTLGNECSHLRSLTLDSVKMGITDPHPALISMFRKLKQFVLNECSWTVQCPMQIFFGENSTLEELSLNDCCRYNPNSCKLQLKEFRALKVLRLENCESLLTSAELKRCFESNAISVLSLTHFGSNVNLFEFELINSLCNSLESLTLAYHSNLRSYQLSRLRKLKKFRILCSETYNVDDAIKKLHVGIEELELVNVYITSEMMEYFKSFKQLRHLSFERCTNSIKSDFFIILPTTLPNLQHLVYNYSVVKDRDIIHMFRSLPHLKYLNLLGCNMLADDTYFEIVDILMKDLQRSKLKFIPPQLESFQCLKNVDNLKEVLC